MERCKNARFGWMLLALWSLAPAALGGQNAPPDKRGCSDSPLLSRVSGCRIYDCQRKEWDAVKIPVDAAGKVESIEGEKLHIYYECADESYSRLKVVRNAETALRQGGYTIVFSGQWEGDPALTARKGPQWIAVSTGSGRYWVTSVKAQEMAQEMRASAAAMASDITAAGHVAVYGIYFDTDRAEIKPESASALTEIAKLLNANAALTVLIVGHTDSVGTLEHNMQLSQARAGSVVTALVANHGIAASRLKAMGVGPAAPVASNRTEDGRAKNRRVDLVER